MTSARGVDRLITDRHRAERVAAVHLQDYLSLFQDRRVMATLSAEGWPRSDADVERWLRFSIAHWDEHGFGLWTFRNFSDERFVGRAGLKRVEVDGQPEIELAYALVPEFWGQGRATEMSRAVLRIAFEELGLSDVVCYTLTTNHASRRVMEKLGFRYEREFTRVGMPHLFFRLTKDHWPAGARSGNCLTE